MTITYRRAHVGDAPRLYPRWLTMRQHNASHDARIELAAVDEDEFTTGLAESLARPGATVIVADAGDVIAGFLSANVVGSAPDRVPERRVSVGYIFVEPGYRRQGVAQSLMNTVREWAATQPGVTHLEMPVLAADAEAAAFWQSVGFSPFIQRLWSSLDSRPGP